MGASLRGVSLRGVRKGGEGGWCGSYHNDGAESCWVEVGSGGGLSGRVAGLLSSCGRRADGRARLGWNEVCDRICGTVFLQETVMRISLLSVTGVALLFLAGCQTKV